MTQPTDPLAREKIELVFTVLSTLYTRAITGTTPATRSYSTAQLKAATGINRGEALRRILKALYRHDLVAIDQPRFNPECDDYRWTITVKARNFPAFKQMFDVLINTRLFTVGVANG